MIRSNDVVLVSEDVKVEIEPAPDGYASVRLIWQDTTIDFYGVLEDLRMFFNGCSDLVVDAEVKRDAELIEARKQMLFTDDVREGPEPW